MKNTTISFFALSFVALLLFSGCTYSDLSESMRGVAEEMKPQNFTLNASQDLARFHNGSCIGMICENVTSTSFPFNLFYKSSLKGGVCYFAECNETKYYEITKLHVPANASVRNFMVGAGPSFLSFADANTYCNNTMQMSVKWLVANEQMTYPLPAKERAECLLDKGVIPVYVLYSQPRNINITRTAEIAAALKDAGPVIIVTDAELTDEEERMYHYNISDQIKAIRANCPNCLVAMGVKLNGTSEYNVSRNYFMDCQCGAPDLFAYGLNSHYFSDCNPSDMIWRASNFSKSVLKTYVESQRTVYSKPSVIIYTMFDEGPSSDGSCRWTKETVGNAYSMLYEPYIEPFAAGGIIGFSLYSLYGIGPLNCENCALVDPNFASSEDICTQSFFPEPKNPRFFNFFGFCQAYYNGVGEGINSLPPLVFSNGSKSCNYAQNTNILRFGRATDSTLTPFSISSVTDSDMFYSCAGCVGKGDIPTRLPNQFQVDSSKSQCNLFFPQIEIAADTLDMDPTLLRAAVWQESNFSKCAVSYVPKSWKSCNIYNESPVNDPDKCCPQNNEKWYVDPAHAGDPVTPCRPQSQITGTPGEECKPCAYGLAQVIEYPSDIYIGHSAEQPAVVRACGSKLTPYAAFNPFRVFDGPCDYSYKFMYFNLPAGRDLVNRNKNDLNAGANTAVDENKREWYSVFFGLDLMFGHQSRPACHLASETQLQWIAHFAAQRNLDCSEPITCDGGGTYAPEIRSACCGNKDFLNYMKYCEHNGSFSYAYDILDRYKELGEKCDNLYCPERKLGDRNPIKYLCDNHFMETECCAAASTWFGYSATVLCLNPPLTCAKYCNGFSLLT